MSSPENHSHPSAFKTFAESEGGGIIAGMAGGALGGRYLSRSKMFRKAVANKKFQAVGGRIFGTHVSPGTKSQLKGMTAEQRTAHRAAYKEAKKNGVTPLHAGSELGAHVVGSGVSYVAIKHNLSGHKQSDNKYLQKAASLVENLH